MKRSSGDADSSGIAPKRTRLRKQIALDGLPAVDPISGDGVDELLLSYPDDWRPSIRSAWSDIRTHYVSWGRLVRQFVFRSSAEGPDDRELKEWLKIIYAKTEEAQKYQISLSTLLQNRETEEFRVYKGHQNEALTLFERPRRAASAAELDGLLDAINLQDHLEVASNIRPMTKWSVISIVSYHVTTYSLGDMMPRFGALRPQRVIVVPRWIRFCRQIWLLRQVRDNNACFFNALAAQRLGRRRNIETDSFELQREWCRYRGLKLAEFDGTVTSDEFDALERCFRIKINLYCCREDRFLQQLRLSQNATYEEALNLFRLGGHLCLIRDLQKVGKVFGCDGCEYVTPRHADIIRHRRDVRSCGQPPREQRRGGNFLHTKCTLFEQLEKLEGLEVTDSQRFGRYFCCWDTESYQRPMPVTISALKSYETELSIVCASVDSNVPGFDQKFFRLRSESGETDLVRRILVHLLELQEATEQLRRTECAGLFKQIQERRLTAEAELAVVFAADEELTKYLNWEVSRWTRYEQQLDRLCEHFSVYAYNAHFDLNLIRDTMMEVAFGELELKIGKIIKSHRRLLLMQLGPLNFKCAYNLIGGGSLRSVLKSFASREVGKKLRFPFCWLTDPSKLDSTAIPALDEWYDELSGRALPVEKWEKCRLVFESNNCRSMWDYLELYCNSDVKPLVKAMERLYDFWASYGICQNTRGISLPGLSMQLIVDRVKTQNGLLFWLPTNNKRDDIVAEAVDTQIAGGLSLIFTRRAEVGEKIAGTEFRVGSIVGMDFRMLYSYELSREQLGGVPGLWSKEAGDIYRRQMLSPYGSSMSELTFCYYLQWTLDRKEHLHGKCFVEHRFQLGQLRVGGSNYPLDAAVRRKRWAFSFLGCRWHECWKCMSPTNPRDPARVREKMEELRKQRDYFKKIGWSFWWFHECEIRKLLREETAFRDQILKKYVWLSYGTTATKAELLDRVRTGAFYGLLTGCSVRVLREKWHLWDAFPPIFKHATLEEKHHLGEMMRDWHAENNIKFGKRRTLLSSFYGEKMTITTNLAQFYLEHGIEVSDFDHAVEFKRVQPFKEFIDRVAQMRLEADRNPEKKVFANQLKLICNSFYGRTLVNSARWLNVKIVSEMEDEIQRHVRSADFKYAEPYGKGFWEIGTTKQKFKQEGCRTIGLNVLQGSKLSMLRYFWDFLSVCFEGNFVTLLCDTDSIYAAFRGSDMDNSVPAHKRSLYDRLKKRFVAETDAEKIPGKMCLEWQGSKLIGLASKAYYGVGTRDKTGLKGVQRAHNSHLTYEKFDQILRDQSLAFGTNKGLELKAGRWHLYKLRKKAISFCYYKRLLVAPDGVRTRCLDYLFED